MNKPMNLIELEFFWKNSTEVERTELVRSNFDLVQMPWATPGGPFPPEIVAKQVWEDLHMELRLDLLA